MRKTTYSVAVSFGSRVRGLCRSSGPHEGTSPCLLSRGTGPRACPGALCSLQLPLAPPPRSPRPARPEAKGRAYPRLRVVALDSLKVNRAHTFDYPLKGDTSVLIDMGRKVPGGVGPDRSIVAFSAQCQHMGCPVAYRRKSRELFCPCHQSRYDPERLGSIIQGVAMRPLPKIELQVRNGAVYAIGVDGLIYGRRSNLAPGKKVGGHS